MRGRAVTVDAVVTADRLGPHKATVVSDFELHAHANDDAERGTVLCALRGVGDEDALKLVMSVSPLAYPRKAVPSTVSRAIRSRLAKSQGAVSS